MRIASHEVTIWLKPFVWGERSALDTPRNRVARIWGANIGVMLCPLLIIGMILFLVGCTNQAPPAFEKRSQLTGPVAVIAVDYPPVIEVWRPSGNYLTGTLTGIAKGFGILVAAPILGGGLGSAGGPYGSLAGAGIGAVLGTVAAPVTLVRNIKAVEHRDVVDQAEHKLKEQLSINAVQAALATAVVDLARKSSGDFYMDLGAVGPHQSGEALNLEALGDKQVSKILMVKVDKVMIPNNVDLKFGGDPSAHYAIFTANARLIDMDLGILSEGNYVYCGSPYKFSQWNDDGFIRQAVNEAIKYFAIRIVDEHSFGHPSIQVSSKTIGCH